MFDTTSSHVTTPFDTGAIATDKFTLEIALADDRAKQEFVENYAWKNDEQWVEDFWRWVGESFADNLEKLEHDAPEAHYCDEFADVVDENWFWETRVAMNDIQNAELAVEMLYLDQAKRSELRAYCKREIGESMTHDEAQTVIAVLDDIAVDFDFEEDALDIARVDIAERLRQFRL